MSEHVPKRVLWSQPYNAGRKNQPGRDFYSVLGFGRLEVSDLDNRYLDVTFADTDDRGTKFGFMATEVEMLQDRAAARLVMDAVAQINRYKETLSKAKGSVKFR